MSDRQPSLTETRDWLSLLESVERCAKTVDYVSNGILLMPKYGRNARFYKHIFSDVSRRCHDCGRILVDKYDAVGNYVYASENRDNYWRNWRNSEPHVSVCFGCYNRRRPLKKAALLWNENRLLQKRMEGLVYEQRKNSRATSGVSSCLNGGGEGGQAVS